MLQSSVSAPRTASRLAAGEANGARENSICSQGISAAWVRVM